MTILTNARDTPTREGLQLSVPLKAGAKIFQGSLVAIDSTGFAVRPAASPTLGCAGVALETVDNSTGANGAASIEVAKGRIYRFDNSTGADLIGLANIGKDCFLVDDTTVALTSASSTRSKAGVIADVDVKGVWVAL